MEDLILNVTLQHAVLGLIIAATMLLQAIRLKIEHEDRRSQRRRKKVRTVIRDRSDPSSPL
jgi:heme A synthase